MLIMTGHYGALTPTSSSQSAVSFEDVGRVRLALNSEYACVEQGYLSVTIERKKKRKTDREWSLVLLNINI